MTQSVGCQVQNLLAAREDLDIAALYQRVKQSRGLRDL